MLNQPHSSNMSFMRQFGASPGRLGVPTLVGSKTFMNGSFAFFTWFGTLWSLCNEHQTKTNCNPRCQIWDINKWNKVFPCKVSALI